MCHTHQIIVLILERGGVDGQLCTVVLECLRQTLGPQNGQVRLRSSTQIFQSMQITEAVLGNQSSAVDAHTTDRFSNPLRVAGEQCVVFRSSCELDHTQLHDEVVDVFLSLFFSQSAVVQITLNVDVQECGGTAEAHCCTVLILDSTQICKVCPLDCFLCIGSRNRNIIAVLLCHVLQSLQSLDLVCQFFTQADLFFGHGAGSNCLLVVLVFDQAIDTVQSHTAIVTDDTAATISIRQTGDDCIMTSSTHFRCVNIEYALVMCLSVVCEDIGDFRIYFIAVSLACFFSHTDTAERLQRTLQRLVSLQTYDSFQILVDITCFVRIYCRYQLGIHVQNAAVFTFFLEQIHYFAPQLCCGFCRASQEAFVTLIRSVVLLDEVTNVDGLFPSTANEAFPCFCHCLCHFKISPLPDKPAKFDLDFSKAQSFGQAIFTTLARRVFCRQRTVF